MRISPQGTLPEGASEEWFTVEFPANAEDNEPEPGNPRIEFEAANEAFEMDVLTGCNQPAVICGDGDDGGGIGSWSFNDEQGEGVTAFSDRAVEWPGRMWIRVYRNEDIASCAGYQIQVSAKMEAPTSPRRALIKVGYACNDLCTFCHTEEVRHIDDTAINVARKIDRAAELKHSMVVLSGGEPTIRPELVAWARRSAARGMDFGLVTNGRMLSYRPLVEKLIEARLGYVYLSLHGGSAKVHNACVRSNAFDETYGGLKELSGRGLHLTANCVITRSNLPHLKELVDSIEPLEDVALQFSMTEPKGGALRLFNQVVPRVTDVAQAVIEAIEYGRSKNMGHRLAHGGIPLCLLPGLEHLYGDLKTHNFATMTEVGEPDFSP